MRVLALIGILLCCVPCLQAEERGGQVWLDQADSLRNAGQDAAALDFLNSAEQQFRRSERIAGWPDSPKEGHGCIWIGKIPSTLLKPWLLHW